MDGQTDTCMDGRMHEWIDLGKENGKKIKSNGDRLGRWIPLYHTVLFPSKGTLYLYQE